ncbi:MAG: hypothetical protein M3163_15225 [Actinomycetota bacterium]|nr:hypothetical protein [Actinomycetota bacterium]
MANVRVWEDDPLAGAEPVERAQAKLPKSPLGISIEEAAPPAKLYEPGTEGFRYWTAADALARGTAFWKSVMPRGTSWQAGKTLPVRLDAGDKLNAVYTRGDLRFFRSEVNGTTVSTGESPDVVSHELGHAVLDAVRPHLWDAMSHEVAAFHESFGDMSAILVALQQPAVRDEVLAETGGSLYRSSRLSRVAEQLGWGQRQRQPCAAETDCLRNAVNCFAYQRPSTLPLTSPAVLLSSLPHSFSRVFTGGFFQMYAAMVLLLNRPPTSDDLLQASKDAGRLLITAVRAAPVVPDYFAQVAAHLLEADASLFDGRYAQAIQFGMAGKGILSLQSARAAAAFPGPTLAGDTVAGTADLPLSAFGGAEFALDRPVLMRVPGQPRRLAGFSVASDGGPLAAAPPEEVGAGFLRELLLRQRVAMPDQDLDGPGPLKTHRLVDRGDHLAVERVLVD